MKCYECKKTIKKVHKVPAGPGVILSLCDDCYAEVKALWLHTYMPSWVEIVK